jgi:hypothetical protein
MYWRVAKEQKRIKLSKLLSSNLSVYYLPIVSNTFIRRTTSSNFLVVFANELDNLEIELELWPVIVIDRVVGVL